MSKKLIILGADFSANSLPKGIVLNWKNGFADANSGAFYPNGQPNQQGTTTTGWKSTDFVFLPSGVIGSNLKIKAPFSFVCRLTFSNSVKALISTAVITVDREYLIPVPAGTSYFAINFGQNGQTLNPDNPSVSKLTESQIAQISVEI